MSKLKKIKIGKYIEVLTDYHSNGSYKSLRENVTLLNEKNYAVMIRTLNFEKNDFKEDLIYVNKESYDHLSKSKVYPNDILTNKIANPGSIYIMPDIKSPVTCGMNLFLIRFSSDVNQRYMYYCMKNSETYIKSLAHGTTTKTITKDEIKDIDLLLHIEKEEQDKIEKLLTDIDTKILINGKINDNLSNMAQDIYMHYFFKKSPNGKLNDILFEADKSKVQVGDAKNCRSQFPFFTSGASILTWDEFFVDGRYCFLNTGGNADVKFYVGKSAYSTDTWCIYTNNDMTDYLYLLLSTIKEELNKKYFQGTGLKHLQKYLLRNKDIYIPTETELYNFNNIIKPLFNNISKNTREIEELINLRDFLLPLLMNGQATIE